MTTTWYADEPEIIHVRVPVKIEVSRVVDSVIGEYYAWQVLFNGYADIASHWVSMQNLRKPKSRRSAIVQARAMLHAKFSCKRGFGCKCVTCVARRNSR